MTSRKPSLLPLLLGLFFAASAAYADVKGQWSGWGEWNYDGSGTHCSTIRFRFEESATELTRLGGQLDCDFVFMEEGPLTLKKEGQNLLLNDQIVGSFDDNTYQWLEPYSEKVKIKVFMRRSGLHMDYLENWFGSGDRPLYDIKARLFIKEE